MAGNVAAGNQSSELLGTACQRSVAMPTVAQYVRIASCSLAYGVTLMWRATPRRKITRVLSPAPVSSVTALGVSCSSMKRQSAGLMPKVARPPCTMGDGMSSDDLVRVGITRGDGRAPSQPEGSAGPSDPPTVECDHPARHLSGAQGREALR